MRRLSGDSGAVAVLVALLTVVLFGFGAFAIDISSLWSERQQLQNGADGSSLAVAQLCAAGPCSVADSQAFAKKYADGNANDGASNIEELCGSSGTGLPACTDPPASTPPGEGWVMVRTQTGSDSGSGLVPPILAKVLVPGYNGSTVHTYAIANYGPPASVTSDIPLIFSLCEWSEAVGASVTVNDDGSLNITGTPTYAPSPVYTETSGTKVWADPSAERTIYFHDTTEAGTCPAGPAGSDLPGGFGWLQPDPNECQASSTSGDWFDDKTGIAVPSDCSKSDLAALVGTELDLPVYGETNGLTGTNGEYKVVGFADFYLTGYSFPGAVRDSVVTGKPPCTGSQRCISGFFLKGVVPPGSGGKVGDGTSLGANIVGLYQ
jgi:hypothetical protein